MTTRAIRGATLIDGTGADPVRSVTVLVEGARITAVGPDHEVHIPAGAETIDASGRTLLPGMIDCHVHVTISAVDMLHRLMSPPSLRILLAVPNLMATLQAGFTTVRDAAGAPLGVKMAVEQGIIPGPRMQISITMLSQTGGHGDSLTRACVHVPLFADIPDIPNGVVDGIEPIRQRVREILAAGADWIKLATSGGVLSQTDEPSAAQFTLEEIRTAVYEAEADGGKKCMAHAQGARGIRNAIVAGVKSIEHGIFLEDETLEMMKQRDVFLVPTLIAPVHILRQAERDPGAMPPWAVEKTRMVLTEHHANFQRAVKAGVKIAMGTDAGLAPHGQNAEELSWMVRNGMTSMEAIVSATSRAAELLRLDRAVGSIETGKLADLILVDGDPLQNIDVLQDPSCIMLVMKDGQVYKDMLGQPWTVHPANGHIAHATAPRTSPRGV